MNKVLENLPSLYFENCRAGTCGKAESLVFDSNDIESIDMYIKTKIEKLTVISDDPNSDMTQSRLSLYYTPTERSAGSKNDDVLAGVHINYYSDKPAVAPFPTLETPSTSKMSDPNLKVALSSDDLRAHENGILAEIQASASLPELTSSKAESKPHIIEETKHDTAL